MDKYRVFISYSHENQAHVNRIVEVLKDNGLLPMWDENFAAGTGFTEQIKTFIAHADVFLPFITADSSKRGWVHQEIGYATALNIPVLPVTIGEPPEGIIQPIQAVRLDENLSGLSEKLSYSTFEDLVKRAENDKPPMFVCARDNMERPALMVELANTGSRMGQFGCVRQRGSLTTFHIPNKRVWHQDWLDRYDGDPPPEYYRRCLLGERLALEKHAEAEGCKLIISPFALERMQHAAKSRSARLQTLITFLETHQADNVLAFVDKGEEEGLSLTIVGDWFSAEAVAAQRGRQYRHTNFTRHAPC